ncbi:ABC transporter permease [Lysobacter sp. HDW10]|uniref:ABC transporter permease n=1 Tax=Lysobacter sp. HDW10 TaxID=2714936 RepID=UPI00140B6494|nr:ABC transporter permease [Lysobacter sp. HDW10]QIK80759.1 ABC transporter permease [Lysobacter sp. HDW10]
MSRLKTVLTKELRELSRDRKTLGLTLFMSPVLIVLLIFGMGTFMKKKHDSQMDKELNIAMVGAEYAPNLVSYLKAQGIHLKQVSDPDASIRNQDEDVYLRIGKDFDEKWRKGEPAMVEVVSDSTRQDASIPARRLQAELQGYNQVVGGLRLVARGISPAVISPMVVTNKDLSTPEARKGLALSFLPYLLILGGFIGGAAFVIDMTAGERERQSLEPLLTTPASRNEIVSGKILASVCIGMLSVFFTCVAFKFAAVITPGLGTMMDVSMLAVLKMMLILVPMVAIGSALLTVISSNAKSVKEAQSYMSMLMLLPMLPTIILMINPVKNQLWMFAIPFLSQNQLLLKVLRSENIALLEWLVYFGANLAIAWLLWFAAVKRYQNEKLAVAS